MLAFALAAYKLGSWNAARPPCRHRCSSQALAASGVRICMWLVQVWGSRAGDFFIATPPQHTRTETASEQPEVRLGDEGGMRTIQHAVCRPSTHPPAAACIVAGATADHRHGKIHGGAGTPSPGFNETMAPV